MELQKFEWINYLILFEDFFFPNNAKKDNEPKALV